MCMFLILIAAETGGRKSQPGQVLIGSIPYLERHHMNRVSTRQCLEMILRPEPPFTPTLQAAMTQQVMRGPVVTNADYQSGPTPRRNRALCTMPGGTGSAFYIKIDSHPERGVLCPVCGPPPLSPRSTRRSRFPISLDPSISIKLSMGGPLCTGIGTVHSKYRQRRRNLNRR